MFLSILILLFISHVAPASSVEEIPPSVISPINSIDTTVTVTVATSTSTESTVPDVPFYSQFKDITSPTWKKVGCGIASLAMLIDYYEPPVSLDVLLKQGIDSKAYLEKDGWTHKGLIDLSEKYGLEGNSFDLGNLSSAVAFERFKDSLEDGPVIASIHYNFDPKSTIPHLVVINGIDDGVMYYNDPAEKSGSGHITTAAFQKAWKQKFIVIRPA